MKNSKTTDGLTFEEFMELAKNKEGDFEYYKYESPGYKDHSDGSDSLRCWDYRKSKQGIFKYFEPKKKETFPQFLHRVAKKMKWI